MTLNVLHCFGVLACCLPCATQTGSSAHTTAAEAFGRERKGGDVWIVAPSGGDFTQIYSAILAAADGDTLLVRTGSYQTFAIDNKSLNIVEDTGATAQLFGGFVIKNLAPERAVVISGLRTGGMSRLDDNLGSVRLESCDLHGFPALSIGASTDVVISRSTITGADGESGIDDSFPGGDGVDVISSSVVSVYETVVTGGKGGVWFGGPQGGNGGHGWKQSTGFLFAAGSRFKGGKGADGRDDCFMANGGHGGNGMMSPADSHGMDNVFQAGGGGGACGQGHSGGSGLPGSMAETLTGLSQLTTLANPVRDQNSVPITLEGDVGSTVFLVVSHRPSHVYMPLLHGVLLVDAPYFRVFEMGTIPASGILSTSVFVPDIWVPDDTAVRYFTQAVFQSTSGMVTLSNPTTLVVLDHGF